jgi:uncharacterized protein
MMSRYGPWAFAAAITIALGAILGNVRLPAAWLIAGILGAAIATVVTRRKLDPPRKAMSAAQGVIGVAAFGPLLKFSGSDLVQFAGCALFSTGSTIALSIALGLLLARMSTRLDLATANLSVMAGASVTACCVARELEADERYVALSQYLRMTIVALTMPLVASQLATADPAPLVVAEDGNLQWEGLLALATIIVAGGSLARLIKTPVPFLLGPMLAAAVLAMASPTVAILISPNNEVKAIAYIVIGWQAGGGFALDTLRKFVRHIPLILMFIVLTIAGCFAIAVAVSALAGVSLADAYLATTPGGIFSAMAIANEVHSGPVVVTLQIVRMPTLVFVIGMFPKIIEWLLRRTEASTHSMAAGRIQKSRSSLSTVFGERNSEARNLRYLATEVTRYR